MTVSVPATPYPFEMDPATTALVIIDMQRDFLEPGGFGEPLGNDVVDARRGSSSRCRSVLAAARAIGMIVIHTREGHRPDMTDCPPAKLARGKLRRADRRPRARTAGSSSAARTATTSSRSSRRSTARPSSTSPARARSTRPTSS